MRRIERGHGVAEGSGRPRSRPAGGARTCLLLLLAAGAPHGAAGQETDVVIPGVELRDVIVTIYVPPIAIRPLTVVGEDAGLAREP